LRPIHATAMKIEFDGDGAARVKVASVPNLSKGSGTDETLQPVSW